MDSSVEPTRRCRQVVIGLAFDWAAIRWEVADFLADVLDGAFSEYTRCGGTRLAHERGRIDAFHRLLTDPSLDLGVALQ